MKVPAGPVNIAVSEREPTDLELDDIALRKRHEHAVDSCFGWLCFEYTRHKVVSSV